MERAKLLRKIHWLTIISLCGFGLFQKMLSLPDVITEYFGGTDVCGPHDHVVSAACSRARSEAQLAISFNQGIKAFLGVFMGPSLGALSDVHGRRFFLLGAFVVTCVSQWLLCFYISGHGSFMFWIVFDTLAGLIPLLPALASVVADENVPSTRARDFGMLMAAFEMPLIIIPVLAGNLSLSANMLSAGVAFSLSLLLVVFYGETLTEENRLCASGALDRVWTPIKAMSILNSAPIFRRLSIVILSNGLVSAGMQSCFLLYVESAFHIARAQAVTYVSLLAVGGLCSQLLLLPLLTRVVGLSRTMWVGLCLQTIQNGLLIINTQSCLIASLTVGGVASIVFPATSALKANAARADQQGRIQGAISGLQNFAMGIGPFLFGGLFGLLERPQSPFPVQTLFLLSACLLIPALFASKSLYLHVEDDHSVPIMRRRVSISAPSSGTTRSWQMGPPPVQVL